MGGTPFIAKQLSNPLAEQMISAGVFLLKKE